MPAGGGGWRRSLAEEPPAMFVGLGEGFVAIETALRVWNWRKLYAPPPCQSQADGQDRSLLPIWCCRSASSSCTRHCPHRLRAHHVGDDGVRDDDELHARARRVTHQE